MTASCRRALQVDPDAGAYAGLALGMQVVLASLLLPLVLRLVGQEAMASPAPAPR